MDTVLSSVKSTCDSSIILTRDTNIDLLSSSTAYDMYEQLFDTYQLSCHVTKWARNDKKLINNISSNMHKIKILHSAILPCPMVSDHDGPYIVIILPTNKFEISYKFLRNLKHFELETFVKVQLYYNFLTIFFNYTKIWFHVNGVHNCFIFLFIFPTISFWHQSVFFPSFLWNQNRLGL